MTLPDERYRSIGKAREFLRSLLDPKLTPKVPKKVRKEAYWVLRHFPADYDVMFMAHRCPEVISKPRS
jgi:hypothetical protein